MTRSRSSKAKSAAKRVVALTGEVCPGSATKGVDCGECGSPMQLARSGYGPFWSCTRWPKCSGTHGAHPDGRPLGVPANAVTRRARVEAHAAFDRLWKREPGARRLMSRTQAYRWLQQTLELPECDAHIGQFTITQCDQLIRAVANHLNPETFHA